MNIDWNVYGPIATWAGVAVAALAWATSSALTIWQVRRIRKVDEWRRLSELAGILSNLNNDGKWRQELAIEELRHTPKARVKDALIVVSAALEFWQKQPQTQEIASKLRDLQNELRRR